MKRCEEKRIRRVSVIITSQKMSKHRLEQERPKRPITDTKMVNPPMAMSAMATPSIASTDEAVATALQLCKLPRLAHLRRHDKTTSAMPTMRKSTFMMPNSTRVIIPQAPAISLFLYYSLLYFYNILSIINYLFIPFSVTFDSKFIITLIYDRLFTSSSSSSFFISSSKIK